MIIFLQFHYAFVVRIVLVLTLLTTRSSAVAERPRDAPCHWIFC